MCCRLRPSCQESPGYLRALLLCRMHAKSTMLRQQAKTLLMTAWLQQCRCLDMHLPLSTHACVARRCSFAVVWRLANHISLYVSALALDAKS